MFFILSKLFAFLTSPVSWITILLLAACFLSAKRKQLIIASFAAFYFFSNGFILNEFMRRWEVKAVPLKEIPHDFDVCIVMGGLANYDIANDRVNFNCSSDRLWQALQLYYTGRAEKILITSGSGSLMLDFREAEFLKDYLLSIQVPEEDIIIEPESRNTHENAVNTARLLHERFPHGRFLLITSSYHMRRSVACFKKQHIEVTPYSVDRISGPRKFYLDHLLLPNPRTLINWEVLIHEWIGVLTYKIMGYC